VLPFLGQLPVDGHQEASHRGRTVVSYRSGREIKDVLRPSERSSRRCCFYVEPFRNGCVPAPARPSQSRPRPLLLYLSPPCHFAGRHALASRERSRCSGRGHHGKRRSKFSLRCAACEVPSVNPCNPASPAKTGCPAPRDRVQEDLARMGKSGQKILRRARKGSRNPASRKRLFGVVPEKDSNPADIFRTLSFEVDARETSLVQESKDPSNMILFRNPYVAKVFQGDGRYAKITIQHERGVFLSNCRRGRSLEGRRAFVPSCVALTNVGPYAGDTMHAQILVLLHEFGHVLDLLLQMSNNVDGKSVRHKRGSPVLRAESNPKGRRARSQLRADG